MNPVKVIEKLLLRECRVREPLNRYESCIVCASSVVWRISTLFPESFIISNAAAQVFPNLASIYHAVKDLKVPLVAVVGTTTIDLEKLITLPTQSAEVEFKLLRKTYEENAEILLSLYDNPKILNAALMEINIDDQIEKLLSITEIREPVEEKRLAVCGLILDEDNIYGDKPGFYLINFNGVNDPEEIRNSPILEEIPESVRKQKIKRIHVQF